ncbi:MAG: ABC transporter permease, partial [Bradyrhizobium sp.]|nr:ABC transporter permease [Bradyrhizobium sp.]
MRRALWILAVLLSHWRRHPMQLATLLIGLISATALWSGVQALNQQARNSYDRAAAIFGGARTPMLVASDGKMLPQSVFAELRRAGWPVSPVVEGRVQFDGHSIRLLGIEPFSIPREVGDAPRVGRSELEAFLTPPHRTLISPETLADFGLKEGTAPRLSNDALLPPLMAQQQLAPGVLVVDIGDAQRLLGKQGQISRLLVGQTPRKREPLKSFAG